MRTSYVIYVQQQQQLELELERAMKLNRLVFVANTAFGTDLISSSLDKSNGPFVDSVQIVVFAIVVVVVVIIEWQISCSFCNGSCHKKQTFSLLACLLI